MNAREVKEIIGTLGDIREDVHGKTVLVTGGAGFLGSWLCDVLVELDANVLCIDNLASGLKSNISELLDKDNFTFIRHDITQPVFFDEDLDVVLHLASRASPFEFQRFPIQILKANTLGIWVALGLAKRHKARLLYTSTSEIYGNATEIPTSEEYTGNVNPIGARSCYDEAKRCGESFVTAYRLEHGMDARIARLFNTYGPRMRADDIYGRVVPRFIDQALKNAPITVFGDGSQTRSFCYVTDQIEALLRFAFLEDLDGKTVNVGSDEEITIVALAEIIKKLTNSASNIKFEDLPKDDPLRRRPDIGKAKDLLNWKPKVGLEKGLERTIRWFRMK
ncbi:MAG: UDP-glucuronic acid decarboxylase family protein [Halobacteriota archaeon]|jgi:UDP-glucuronate decarboxylase